MHTMMPQTPLHQPWRLDICDNSRVRTHSHASGLRTKRSARAHICMPDQHACLTSPACHPRLPEGPESRELCEGDDPCRIRRPEIAAEDMHADARGPLERAGRSALLLRAPPVRRLHHSRRHWPGRRARDTIDLRGTTSCTSLKAHISEQSLSLDSPPTFATHLLHALLSSNSTTCARLLTRQLRMEAAHPAGPHRSLSFWPTSEGGHSIWLAVLT